MRLFKFPTDGTRKGVVLSLASHISELIFFSMELAGELEAGLLIVHTESSSRVRRRQFWQGISVNRTVEALNGRRVIFDPPTSRSAMGRKYHLRYITHLSLSK